MEGLCRICGSHSVTLVGIFDQRERRQFKGEVEPDLADMVTMCADVQIVAGDSLPQNICMSCVLDTQTAYRFKRRCELSYVKFSLAIANQPIVKEEPSEAEYLIVQEQEYDDLLLNPQLDDNQFQTIPKETINNNPPINIAKRPIRAAKVKDITSIEETQNKNVQEQEYDDLLLNPQQDDNQYQTIPKETINNNPPINIAKRPIRAAKMKKITSTEETRNKNAKLINQKSSRTLRASPKPKAQSHKCEICTKEFQHHRILLDHMKTHTNSYSCQTCGERFLFKTDLDKHLCFHTNDSTVECPVCLKVFSTSRALDIHKCQQMKERPFACPHCPQTFTHGRFLKAHMLIHPTEAPSQLSRGPHHCGICGVRFTNKAALQVHIHAHKGERPHPCSLCSSCFRSKQALKVHIRTHTGEKPYQCPQCPKTFSDNNNLSKHRRRHTDERPYSCPICLQCFREKHHMKRHVLGKHREHELQLE